MKAVTTVLMVLFALNASAAEMFCRTVVSDGSFGQPRGEREHCVSIDPISFTLVDNANTFFGNPPERLKYQTSGDQILVLRQGQWQPAYRIVGNTLVNGAGAVLTQK